MSPELAVIDPIAELQAKLGVDPDQAEDLANIQVICPVPGKSAEASSLGDFISHPNPKVAEMAGRLLSKAQTDLEKADGGITPEESIGQALGFSAVYEDEAAGVLARVDPKPQLETAAAVPDSKKK
jgi:hypothetical protein